ncbi:MAG: YceI family protein [Paludibacter sp.]
MNNLKFSKYLTMLFVSTIFITTALQAQSLKINPHTSTMVILGTTNVHNFETNVTQIAGELVLNASKQVQSFNLSVPVKSIKSKEKLMDTKTYEAFDADKNPNISFKLTEATGFKVTGPDVEATVTGNLTMAGATKKISFKAIGKSSKAGVYEFKGSIPLKMTDYKMKPPTAMMGMMKVGDAITLKYDVFLEGSPLTAQLDK